jgi:hypothetical protein
MVACHSECVARRIVAGESCESDEGYTLGLFVFIFIKYKPHQTSEELLSDELGTSFLQRC